MLCLMSTVFNYMHYYYIGLYYTFNVFRIVYLRALKNMSKYERNILLLLLEHQLYTL